MASNITQIAGEAANRVVVYYQTQYDSTLPSNSPFGHYVSPLPLVGLITHLIVAAIHLNTVTDTVKYAVELNDNPFNATYYDHMWADLAYMQRRGIKVIGMLGGGAGGTYDKLWGSKFDIWYPQLIEQVRKYKLDGLDLDVEESYSLENIEFLIRRLRQDFGPNFIITLAPVATALKQGGNISGFDYLQLERDLGHEIKFYNTQFYSGFGSISPDDLYIELVDYGPELDSSKIVACTLTNPETGYGYTDPNDTVKSIQMLVDKYGRSFGGVCAFEYFNSLPDRSRPQQWAYMMKQAMDKELAIYDHNHHHHPRAHARDIRQNERREVVTDA